MNFGFFRFVVCFSFLFLISPRVFADEERLGTEGLALLESVMFAIKNQPALLVEEQQVAAARGEFQAQSALFDYQVGLSAGISHDNLPLTGIARAIVDTSKVVSDVSQYDFTLSRQLRSGIVISPNLQMLRTDDNLFNTTSPNEASTNVLLQFPLMKGRGVEATAANETAAQRNYDASLLEQRHEVARTILDTTLAYWAYVAAFRDLQIARESEARAFTLMDKIKSLIEAKEVAAAELKQVEANLAERSSLAAAAEQNLIEARQNLGLVMGTPADEIFSLPAPSDDFPSIPSGQDPLPSSLNLVDYALTRRSDLFALRKREESANILQTAAVKDLKPTLNLNVNVGYSGLNEGGGFSRYFSPFKDNVAGLNTAAVIQYAWPIGNNFAQGILAQRKSEQRRASIEAEELVRRITSAVKVASAGISNTSLQVKKSEEAVAAFQEALENEKQKLQLGLSTLLDLISMEENLTNAERNRNLAQLRYASSVIQLRYETGGLVPPDSSNVTIDVIQLTRPPAGK